MIARRVRVARSPVSRAIGWMFRDEPAEEGLWLEPCSSVHTWFVRFPIDLAFIGRSGEVLSVARRVPPWRVRRVAGARAVLETRAGLLDSVGEGALVEVLRCD